MLLSWTLNNCSYNHSVFLIPGIKLMKIVSIQIIILFLSTNLMAQNRANNWALGNYQLDFSNGQPEVNFEYADYLNRGIGIISDENGELLFYTDGFSIWNKNHQLMPNGTELIPSGGPAVQESLVVPAPGNSQLYYIITVDPWNGQNTSGLYYSIIDLSLDNGLGDVTTKGVKILDNTTNKISAAYHENLQDVWIMTHGHNTNHYYSFLITSDGISSSPILNQIGKAHGFSSGQLKFSTDSRKVVCSRDYEFIDQTAFDLFDFDPATGMLSNEMSFVLPADRDCEGIEFSPDSKKLYVAQSGSSGERGLYQFDLQFSTQEQIQNSRTLLHREINNGFRQLQLATNGNIYITKGGGGGGTGHLGVVSKLNESADKVVVEENGLFLDGGSSFVNFTPNFIQNYFFKTSFQYDGTCQSVATQFEVTNTSHLESVNWLFGEGSTSTDINPEFTYNQPGIYTVVLTANYTDYSDVISKQITIDPFPILELGEDKELCHGSKLIVEDLYASYFWNNGDTTNTTKVQESGYYILEVTNAFGCTSKDSLFVNVIELPEINLSDSLFLENNEPIDIDPGTFDSYSWSTGETTSSITIDMPGWYSVRVTNDFGCEAAKSFYVSDGNEIIPKTNKWIHLNPRPTSLTGNDIDFANDNIGFIVNSAELLVTKNQGDTWETFMPVNRGVDISFINGYGYIVGSTGDIYKSTYLGAGWNKLDASFNDNLNSITLLHKDSILITSDNKLYKSFDGGTSWEIKGINGVNVEDSYFTSHLVGHVACTNGTILKTVDGGESWYETETSNITPSDFFKIVFVNDNIGFATQEHNDVYKTIDGGETWDEIASPDAGYALQFIDENIGFIAGDNGAAHKTVDGGETWSWIGADGRRSGNDLFGIYFLNENVGFATGLKGRILRTYNGGNSWENYSITYNTISEIEISSQQTVFALVGNDVLKSLNRGAEWVNQGSVINGQKTRSISFIDDKIGYAIAGGTPGTSAASDLIYKTLDGGVTWSRQNQNEIELASNGLNVIKFIDENVGFINSFRRNTYKTNDGGITWQLIPSLNHVIREFYFIDSNVGYAINSRNSNGRVFRTSDGGDNWELVYERDGHDIYALHFIDSQVGYIIGDPDVELRKTRDGGNSWEEIDIPYEWYEDVYFHTENYGLICDEDGRVFETLDGGLSWTPINELFRIKNLSVRENDIYAYGDFGNIFRSTITLQDQLRFGSVQVSGIQYTNADISIDLFSSLPSVEVYLQYGISESDLEEISIGTVLGMTSENIQIPLTNLDTATTYICRFKVEYNNEIAFSDTESFTTSDISDVILGLEEVDKTFRLYPNPTSNFINIEGVRNLTESILYDIQGNLLRINSTSSNTVDLSDIPAGIYLLVVRDGDIKITRRIIKL